MSQCEHDYICNEYSKICTNCGLQETILTLDNYNVYSAPILKTYDRRHRFKLKLQKLLLLHSGPKFSEPVWKILEKGSMDTIVELRMVLRNSNLKQKHYDTIRLFAKIFCKIQIDIEQDPYVLLQTMFKEFEEIHFAWKRTVNDLFFSSDWLLRMLVKKYCPKLIVFLKPATSVLRNQKYSAMLNTIQTISK
jgi:hypothetical protein